MLTRIAILAGGESRRMGMDKAGLEVAGMTLLEHTARVALAIDTTITVAGRSRRVARPANIPVIVAGRTCPDRWPLASITFLEDAVPGLGPLGGLAAALRETQTPIIALACDLPRLTTEAIRWLMVQSEHSGKHGLVVVNHGQWEPLFSLYLPASLPLIEERLAEGRRSLHGLIESGQFVFADAPDWVCAQLLNVNTPEDWVQAIKEREGRNE